MGILLGFAPWIVYWVLVGNVPFLIAALVALTIAVGAFLTGRPKEASGQTLDIGAVVTFAVLTILTLSLNESLTARWMQPASNAAIFLVALTSVLTGTPFMREFAEADLPADVVRSGLFDPIATRLTWMWVAVFAGMTASSAIPPILRGEATILDSKTPLSFLGYWVIPFSLLGLAALATEILPARMTAGFGDIVRKTTFVAYSEATIDELYYLATQHAQREVGAGQEAYDVRVGGTATPLAGDDARQSWPSTYKVRESRQ